MPAPKPAPAPAPRRITAIVIHCSATPNGRRVTATDIDQWHAARGFVRDPAWRARFNPNLGSIGYHFVIRLNGALETGRALDEVGAHVVGNNRATVGVCMVGTDQFTPAQWAMLKANIESLLRTYPNAAVRGHRDLSPDKNNDGLVEPWEWLKTCPGFDVRQWGKAGFVPDPKNVYQEQAP